MDKILLFVNENWKLIFKPFNLKTIEDKNELLNYSDAILIISSDKKQEIEDIIEKLEENEIIISEIPGDKDSEFDIEEVERLITKVLGFARS